MLRCPTCRREADTAVLECARCATDLSQMVRIHGSARKALQAGRHYLARRDFKEAFAAFKQSAALVLTPEALAGIACVYACTGRYRKATALWTHMGKNDFTPKAFVDENFEP